MNLYFLFCVFTESLQSDQNKDFQNPNSHNIVFNISDSTPMPTKNWFPPSPPWPPRRTPRETKIFFRQKNVFPAAQDNPKHEEFENYTSTYHEVVSVNATKSFLRSTYGFISALFLTIVISLLLCFLFVRKHKVSNNGESLLYDETY